MTIDRHNSLLYLPTSEPGVCLVEVSEYDRPLVEESILNTVGSTPIEEPNKRILGVWDDDTVVGAVAVAENVEAHTAHIEFWTSPDYTNCGYATIAVLALTHHALASGNRLTSRVPEEDKAAAQVLQRAGFRPLLTEAGSTLFERSAEQPRLPVAVIKMRATNGSEGGLTDSASIDDSPKSVEQMITKYSGAKNRAMQSALHDAVSYLAANPLGNGSEALNALGGREPTIQGERIKIWKLKPSAAPELKHGTLLRDTRILYGLVEINASDKDHKTLAILDIISRGDFTKKYT